MAETTTGDAGTTTVVEGPNASGYRYPGSPPFADSDLDRLVFRGRKAEAEAVLHSILSSDLFVLYAISGMGKTSLLNAGVLQQLRDRDLWPVVLRLNDPDESPVELIDQQIQEAAVRSEDIVLMHHPGDDDNADRRTLWDLLGGIEVWSGNRLQQPVLILDQFEELFTLGWSHEVRTEFIAEFGEIVRRHRRLDDGSASSLPPPEVKVVLVIREDSLGELEALSIDVPQIIRNRYRLLGLEPEQAEHAIREPALIDDPRFRSRRFSYTEDAAKTLLGFLRTREERGERILTPTVDPSQLQIICQHLERTVLPRKQEAPDDAPVEVTEEDLGGEDGLKLILRDFYRREIGGFDPQDRTLIRSLCELGLISTSGRRLSLEEGEITADFGVSRDLLQALVGRRLLRAEPRVGSVYYELAHDTLVEPILAYRLQAAEEEEEAARRRRAVRRSRRTDTAFLVAGIAVLLMAVTGVVITISADVLQREIEFATPFFALVIGGLAAINYARKPRTRPGKWRRALAVLTSALALLITLGNGEVYRSGAETIGFTATSVEIETSAPPEPELVYPSPEGAAPVRIPLLIAAGGLSLEELIVTATAPQSGGDVEVTFETESWIATYTPGPSLGLFDEFSYEACPPPSVETACDSSDITVSVIPYALDDVVQSLPYDSVSIVVLENDYSRDLLVTVKDSPQTGEAVEQPDGTIEYTPGDAFEGSDYFTYRACVDSTDDCGNATVTVVEDPREQLVVPNVVGESDAGAVLRTQGFQVIETEQVTVDVPVGQILSQSPLPGETLPPGGQVELIVSAASIVVERVRSGEPFLLVTVGGNLDADCSAPEDGSAHGDIRLGGTYQLRYEDDPGGFIVHGPNQGVAGCPWHDPDTIYEVDGLADNANKLNIWGFNDFTFDPVTGEVQRAGSFVGYLLFPSYTDPGDVTSAVRSGSTFYLATVGGDGTETDCARPEDGSPHGDVWLGGTYELQYVDDPGGFTVHGPNQGVAGCPWHDPNTVYVVDGLAGDNNKLNIWNAKPDFTFDPVTGEVQRAGSFVGYLYFPGSPVR